MLSGNDDLNLYNYVGSNPVNKIDPLGLYTCSGSKENCATVEARLERARAVHSAMKPGADKDKLGKVLDVYGKAGEKNGLSVGFDPNVGAGQASVSKDGTIQVTLRSTFSTFGTGYDAPQDVGASVLVHEGQHGVDGRKRGGNPRNRAEEKATERNAYTTESIFKKAAGTKSFHGMWDPEWPAAEAESRRQQAIEEYAEYSTQSWCARGGNCAQ